VNAMPEEPRVWEIRLNLYATARQAEEVKERIARMLCPDPDHAPPCPIPWSTMLFEADDPDDHADLVEQGRIESRRPELDPQ